MNTRLRDLIDRDVQDLTPDLEALTLAARRRGLSIRRRRQVLSSFGAAAAVAVIAVGASQLQGVAGSPGPGAAAPESEPTASEPAAAGTVPLTEPLTGQATVAGLRQLLEGIAEGRSADFAGQTSPEGSAEGRAESYGRLRWFPADGSGFSDVGLNLQPGFRPAELAPGARPLREVASALSKIYRCERWQRACSVTRQDGATLMTYEEVTPTADGDGIRVTVDLLRADGVRVVASATNGADLPANRWQLSRARPVFSAQQLTSIVSEPWWGPRLPAELRQAANQLPGYDDLSAGTGKRGHIRPSPTPRP